ncbi:MAG: undecaprenyldiphospho-muramoylpentapeptide beta-N-acetylglucosaminyltransferase [Betaproteobacteria bacterium]|nr:undecaprenyldiphospho-muramoylpentapeptide beta-N-acetylglucosaminyltransferase [Betaproteobacteria bacterium]
MNRSILIMAGGTGGHVFPGLAVADVLRNRGWRVIWMGSPTGMEARLVPARGYDLSPIRAIAARGGSWLARLFLPFSLLFAFWQSARAILRERPDVVLGMGGYVAFPGGMMASMLRRPLAIHEQNAIPGLANRILAGLAECVLVAFPGVLKDAEWSGNPVRESIAAIADPDRRYAGRSGRLSLLVVGGSLGAQALNEIVPRALALIPETERPAVVHQSGERHLEALQAAYARAGVAGELLAFVDDMAARYAAADLVICRAGATTVAELAAAGVASVLVPYPHAVDDHQSANARFLSEHGAALLLPQSAITAEELAALLRSTDRAHLLEMARAARALGKPAAAQVVADRCMQLAEGRLA